MELKESVEKTASVVCRHHKHKLKCQVDENEITNSNFNLSRIKISKYVASFPAVSSFCRFLLSASPQIPPACREV